MEATRDDDLVRPWWSYQHLQGGTREQRLALERGHPPAAVSAVDAVHDRVARGGVEALVLVVALVRSAPTAEDRAAVAAGPLENLLVEHGHELAPRIDEAARREPALAEALRSVWWQPPDREPERVLRRRMSTG